MIYELDRDNRKIEIIISDIYKYTRTCTTVDGALEVEDSAHWLLEQFCKELEAKDSEITHFQKQCLANKKEINGFIKAFCHFHINNGVDDSCKECGLDLRNPVHFALTNKDKEGE